MSIIKSVMSSLTGVFSRKSIDPALLPTIENPAYLNSPDHLHSSDPAIVSDGFEYFVHEMGMTRFEHLMDKGSMILWPNPDTTKKPNGHMPLVFHLTLHPEHEIALAALCGPTTEMHTVIKRKPGAEIFQLDLVHIVENQTYYEIECSKGRGREDMLPKLMHAFKTGMDNIQADHSSVKHDSELILSKSLKSVLLGQMMRIGPLPFSW